MANYFNLTLDTTAPANPSVSIEGGATYTSVQLVDLTIGTTDGVTTDYSMLIWGDVDITQNANIQTLEGSSSWITYSTLQQVKLSTGDASKTLYIKIRDDVHNVSSETSDSILLDTTLAVITTSGSDVPKISKISGKNVSAFNFQVDVIFDEYKVKVVAASGAAHDTGIQIGTTNGSTNMSGNAGSYPANTPINCQIYGTDLEVADAGDGAKIIKVFVFENGQWSI